MEGGSGDVAAVWGPRVPGQLGGDGVCAFPWAAGVQAKPLYVPAWTSPARAQRDRISVLLPPGSKSPDSALPTQQWGGGRRRRGSPGEGVARGAGCTVALGVQGLRAQLGFHGPAPRKAMSPRHLGGGPRTPCASPSLREPDYWTKGQ